MCHLSGTLAVMKPKGLWLKDFGRRLAMSSGIRGFPQELPGEKTKGRERSMKYRIPAALAFAFSLLLSVGTAKADGTSLLSYNLTGPVDATFELPVNFTVANGDYGLGAGFYVTPIDLTINGSAVSDDQLLIFSSSFGGAFEDADQLVNLTGPQLYTGLEYNPTMSAFPGGIALFDYNTGAGGYTLTVTSVPTPEPTSILLMGIGLLSLFLMRRLKSLAS
jgi:hypothetical protein